MLSRLSLIMAACAAAFLSAGALADKGPQESASDKAFNVGSAPSERIKATIKAELERSFHGVSIESIAATGMKGIWEVQIGKSILYTDDTGKYLIDGSLYETETRKNMTAEVKEKLLRVDFASLPLSLAIKTVKGSGKRVFATFEDPNCGYCKKMQAPLAEMTDYTMYTFMDPILSPDSAVKAKNIWCAADQPMAWKQVMQTGMVPPPKQGCSAPIAELMALGRALSVEGTPTIIFADGTRAPGLVSAPEFERRLDQASLVANAK
jgi:thiol:disulfide interchange protein DsbC